MLSVSVVMPAFNAKRYIKEAIDSIRDQGIGGCEIIVVDDGSSDGTAEFVQREMRDVRLFVQSNQGVAAARNFGIAQAKGEWIAFLDADDVWLPGKLQTQLAAIEAHPDCKMIYSDWQMWFPGDDGQHHRSHMPTGEVSSAPVTSAEWIYNKLICRCFVWTGTVMIHRSMFEEAGLFDDSMRQGEDYDLWLRVARQTKVIKVNQIQGLYRRHSESLTRNIAPRNYRADVVYRCLERWGLTGPADTEVDAQSVRHALSESWAGFAWSCNQAGRRGLAFRSLAESLRMNPLNMVTWKVAARLALPFF